MNARERFKTSLLGGKADRFFRFETGAWPSTIEKWKSEGLPNFVSSEEKLNEQFYRSAVKKNSSYEKEVTFNEFFHHDPLYRLPIKSGYCDSPLFPKYKDIILSEDDNCYIVRDVDGVTKKIFKENPDLSMPMFLEFPVQQPADWTEELKKEHMNISQIKYLLGDIKMIAKEIGETSCREVPVYITACGGFGHPRNLLGDANLCFAYYDEPDMIKDIMKHWLATNIEILRLVTEYITLDNYLIWEDMSYKNGPLIGAGYVPGIYFTLLQRIN